jgi:NAD-dependent dihydropyrimidine dehydrogenase PreA subunit
MPYVIAEPCIGVKDTVCADVCPVDVIHPRRDEADFLCQPLNSTSTRTTASTAAFVCQPALCPQYSSARTFQKNGVTRLTDMIEPSSSWIRSLRPGYPICLFPKGHAAVPEYARPSHAPKTQLRERAPSIGA